MQNFNENLTLIKKFYFETILLYDDIHKTYRFPSVYIFITCGKYATNIFVLKTANFTNHFVEENCTGQWQHQCGQEGQLSLLQTPDRTT